MSGADVRSIQALDDFRAELARFAADGREAMQQMDLEVAHTLELLDRERRRVEEEVRRRHAENRRAQMALQGCLDTPPDEEGRGPDCSEYVYVARECAMHLRAAEEALQAVQQRIQMVRQAEATYRQQAQRLAQIIDQDVPATRAYLGRQVSTLQSYLAISTPSDALPPLHTVSDGMNVPGGSTHEAISATQDRIADMDFTDTLGRSITVRCWGGTRQTYIRAYDNAQGPVPSTVTGGPGLANLMLEVDSAGVARVKLQDIVVVPDYQHAGIANRLLAQVEEYGRAHQAVEVYGVIESEAAFAFWTHQAAHGWAIVEGDGYYGIVQKSL